MNYNEELEFGSYISIIFLHLLSLPHCKIGMIQYEKFDFKTLFLCSP